VQQAAAVAQRLGLTAVSVIEFGVAGGRGLTQLERLADQAMGATGLRIEVYGFDRVGGLPPPSDYRDLLYAWEPGDFVMDLDKLRRSLRFAVGARGH
jgi:hypothetical protein